MPSIASDRLDSFPEPWKPKAGDKLVGQIIGLDAREMEYGEYPIVTVMTEKGAEISFHAYHTVARNELAKLEPDIGETIGIKYFGKADGATYERYRILMLDRDAVQTKKPDWKAMRTDDTEEEALAPDEADDGDIPF